MNSLDQVRREALEAGYGAVWDLKTPALLENWNPGDYWQRFELDRARHIILAESNRSGGAVTHEFILVRAGGCLVAELRRAVEQQDKTAAAPDGWLFAPPPSSGAIGL